jgi:hypothetical protein
VSVAAIGVDRRGIGVVTVVDAQGQQWHAELARRTSDDEGLNPIALSRNYSVYLRNGGSGSTPTDQHVGRAVLAIARNVKRNEDATPALQLASRSEFWAATGYNRPARRYPAEPSEHSVNVEFPTKPTGSGRCARLRVDLDLHSREAIFGAAYSFIDRCYVWLDKDVDGRL